MSSTLELKHRRHELRKEIKAHHVCMEWHKQFTSHTSEKKDSFEMREEQSPAIFSWVEV